MLKRKCFIVRVSFLVLLAIAPIMAAEQEIGRFPEKGSVEKGFASFYVGRKLFAAGIEIMPGEYNVKWESHGPDATAEFTLVGKSHGVKVAGKIVDVHEKFDSDSMVIGKDPDGRDVIKELQFSGKRSKIIFGCDDPSCFNLQGNSKVSAYKAAAA